MPHTKLRNAAASLVIGASLLASPASARQKPIEVTVFVHQDVTLSVDEIRENYLLHWEKEMAEISDRDIIFEFITSGTPSNTMNYQHENRAVPLAEFDKFYQWHYQAAPEQYHGQVRKALLLTQHPINASTYGIARQTDNTAIASLAFYSAPAHELGHLFGATHENAESGFTFCDTYMADRNPLKAQCYAYSEANRDLIGDYLIQLH